MIRACDDCLRRAHLVGRLAARIAGMLDHPARRTRSLLALPDDELAHAVAGTSAAKVLDGFDVAAARASLRVGELSAVCRHDAAYPRGVLQLVDAPAVLFCAGDPRRLGALGREPAVAVVGARRASPYGLEVAQSLGRGLGVAGVTVVSGLALGIDAAAHRGCLEERGFPVAVLAGGPDIPYPRTNGGLYREIVRTGLVLSEMPPGRRAFRWSFPARNRLMAGLAGMTVLVEAAEASGSIITADFAQDLGRTLGAVPGRITARTAAGSNGLLRDGASVVRGVEDVLDDLLGVGAGQAAVGLRAGARREQLSPEQERVLAAVEAGEGVGGIAQAAGVSARTARIALSRLEAEGLVVRGALGSYERAAGT